MNTRRLVTFAVPLACVVAAAYALVSFDLIGETRSVALQGLPERAAPDLRGPAEMVYASFLEYRSNAAKWSLIHFGALFGSALLSASAGVLLKLESVLADRPERRSDVASVCAAAAALLITLSGLGAFEAKWRANRIAAAEVEALAYEILRGPPPERVIATMQAISRRRSLAIVGEPGGAASVDEDAAPSP